ncbi:MULTISPECIES: metalloregulator ArsR/SmtB family transcription factor [Hyphomicrobiales]|jgi:DNA-binding transcriptional ArsR family regulator|uniref:ArsR/SmtB family transcription factor n=1 Tax=Methylobacterium sp. CCH7-A2 TaxID=1768789 RepID=UPI000836F813|nr:MULTISPECIES: metalloregulator ArsR/SmtB family transcription factor [Hyphomicrobiales]
MNQQQALNGFGAIAQETRLQIVRLLIKAGAEGMPAGEITAGLEGASAPRVSFHLRHLEQAGLITSKREGRLIIYSAVFSALSDLVAFLMRDCCQGHCEVCDRAIALFARCTGRPQALELTPKISCD